MAFKQPIEKLPLNVRKAWRDEFEHTIGDLQTKMATLVGVPSYTFHADPHVLFAYAEPRSMAENHPGSTAFKYFEAFVAGVAKYTKDGADADAKAVFAKVVPSNTATIVASEKVSTIGFTIAEGQAQLLFNPKYYSYNISQVADNLPKEVDIALDALGGDELPIAARRSIDEHLTPKLADLSARLEKLFGKPYTFEFDIATTLKAVQADKDNTNRDWPTNVPRWTAAYFEAGVKTLEDKGFGGDDMLQEAFNDAAEKGVVRFVLVDKVPNGRTYHDVIFEDGEFKLVTSSRWFGTNISTIAEKVTDRL